jgi:hypothetical protein
MSKIIKLKRNVGKILFLIITIKKEKLKMVLIKLLI